tara:strand:+ start:2843 stop:3448 length:606 start_codon:yes stop_codon:yes gene_type:complete
MTSVSNKQISKPFRANRPNWLQWLGRTLLSIWGWKVLGSIKEEYGDENLVIVVAPHTSNWDGILGMAALAGLDARIAFFGKHTVFRYFGLGAFLRYMGGIPVDRSNPGGIMADAIQQIKDIEFSLIAMAPEGTRSKVSEWKTGFLRISEAIDAKIIPVSLDFSKKEILLGDIFNLSGNKEEDLKDLKNYFSAFTPKHPENF